MKSRHEWRALAAGCDVAAPKIAYHRDGRALGDSRRIDELDRVTRARIVADGLAMTPDRAHVFGANARCSEQSVDGACIKIAENISGVCGAVKFVRSAIVE